MKTLGEVRLFHVRTRTARPRGEDARRYFSRGRGARRLLRTRAECLAHEHGLLADVTKDCK